MVPAIDQTLTQWLASHVNTRPDAPALVDQDGVMTYSELAQAVARLSSGLKRMGIDKGDTVGVQLPNVRNFVIAFLAVTARGAIFQTLHMPYRSKELRELLRDSGAKAVFVTNSETDSRARDVLSVRPQLSSLEHVIVHGADLDGTTSLKELMQSPEVSEYATPVTTQDGFLLLYTSGTTAAPKGVPHVYQSFLNNALLSSSELQIGADDKILSLAPMSHLYGLFTVHLALAKGATICLLPAFNPKTLLEDLVAFAPTHVFAAPAHFAPFVSQGLLSSQHLQHTRLVCLSGATVPPTLAAAVDDKLANGNVVQLWGMSELQAGTFGRPGDPAEKRFSTAGSAAPNAHLRVLDDSGLCCAPGVEGMLQVRGPSLFSGYLNRPEETNKSFDENGWFATGDLAMIDADGFVTITGRTKEIINRGGIKYNPIEIEKILIDLPAIQECAIIAVPDEILGERACLCVQLTPGAELSLDAIKDTLSEVGMAKYKWPEQLFVVDEMPVTPTRKVMRGVLADLVRLSFNQSKL